MHTESGPDAAGATSESLLRETQAGPGGGPACVFQGVKPATFLADRSGDSLARGLTAITPAASEIAEAAAEDTAASSSFRPVSSPYPSWTTRPSMPPATVTTWPETCPDN